MSVSLVRRSALLLVILAATCRPLTKQGPPPPPPAGDVFCTAGNGSKSRPMICVDDTTLTPNPRHAPVYDVEADNQKPPQPSNKHVVIHWFAQHSVNLQMEWKDDSCADKIVCDGSGQCTAKIKVKLKERETKRCIYGMWLGTSKLDPDGEIVVNPCCW